MKINAQKHFDQLQQKIQRNASQIDNYLEQRVMVLQNCARLLDKAIDLDKDTFENIARYRSGNVGDIDTVRTMLAGIDVLVDGKFVEELKNAGLLFRGSSNQNIIDVKASLAEGKTVLLDGIWERKMGSMNIEEG